MTLSGPAGPAGRSPTGGADLLREKLSSLLLQPPLHLRLVVFFAGVEPVRGRLREYGLQRGAIGDPVPPLVGDFQVWLVLAHAQTDVPPRLVELLRGAVEELHPELQGRLHDPEEVGDLGRRPMVAVQDPVGAQRELHLDVGARRLGRGGDRHEERGHEKREVSQGAMRQSAESSRQYPLDFEMCRIVRYPRPALSLRAGCPDTRVTPRAVLVNMDRASGGSKRLVWSDRTVSDCRHRPEMRSVVPH